MRRPGGPDRPDFSIVLPAFNEEGAIEGVLAELFSVVGDGDPFEVVVVDDGSTDGTAEILDRLAGRTPYGGRLRVCRHSRTCGKSAALRTGIGAALGAWVVTMDADGQNDPRDIAALRAAAATTGGAAGPALVFGIRTSRRTTVSKRIQSRIANVVRRRLLGDDCPDTGCGFKYIRPDVFIGLPQFDGLHRFLPALVKAHGYGTAGVPVADRVRLAGVSKYRSLPRAVVGVFDLLGVLWLRKRTTPVPAVHDDGMISEVPSEDVPPPLYAVRAGQSRIS